MVTCTRIRDGKWSNFSYTESYQYDAAGHPTQLVDRLTNTSGAVYINDSLYHNSELPHGRDYGATAEMTRRYDWDLRYRRLQKTTTSIPALGGLQERTYEQDPQHLCPPR